ncbi:DNA polymerase III subunit delta' [Martelella alba]|uniref:DNA polymerase III subunit delta' n=1 Tax=Martelella alba TaxID=2590451 RepID=A0ABY2SP77_9HYPH|nr:DNA polymerase III subunit delta' [Martelella alba]TKI07706.1 DNA polymerase III subunit delta' [Martelella alba]
MNWYPWLTAPYRQIIDGYRTGRGHHALLLHALPGIGGESLCYALSRWLICLRPDGGKSCGRCRSCQLMLAGTHPDFYRPEPEKGRTSLGVDSIRQVIDPLYERARQGGGKVVWLDDCESLTEQAANALLKTLEEPPEETFFILACREPARLLPTLRSRCLYYALPTPEESVGLRWLRRQGIDDVEQARTALRIANGAPVAALTVLRPERWAQRQALCDAVRRALSEQDALSLLPLLNKDKDDAPVFWLLGLFTDALKWQQGAGAYAINQDQLPLVAELAERHTAAALHHLLHRWLDCRRQYQSAPGINRELLLTRQLLDWEATAAGGPLSPWTL